MKQLRSIITVIMASVLMTGCDFLDLVPENDVETIESIFERRNQVDNWVETCYSYYTQMASARSNVGLTGADEFVTGNYVRQYVQYPVTPLNIGDGLQMAQSPYGNIWQDGSFYTAVRYCNTFLENIHLTHNMTQEEKDLWTAEVKAVKAFYYFELVRRYGPIILLDQNIGVEESLEEMRMVRRPLDECIGEIVRLLDEAIKVLPNRGVKGLERRGYFSLESAMALKAKALVYAASPLFNGNTMYSGFVNRNGEQLVNTSPDIEKWRIAAEAVDQAVAECERVGYALVNKNGNSSILGVMKNIEQSVQSPGYLSDEMLFAAKIPKVGPNNNNGLHTYILPNFIPGDPDKESSVWGCMAPSLQMVELYYTENGLPIEYDVNWVGKNIYEMGEEQDVKYEKVVNLNGKVLNLHLRREPRFYACIAADGTYWQRGTSTSSKDYNYLVDAFRGSRFGSQFNAIREDQPQNRSGYWLKKHTYSDIATKNYEKGLTAKGDDPFPLMRLAELYLMQAEAWNEYSGPSQKVYDALNVVRRRAGIPNVEDSWTPQYATDPGKISTTEGMREIIQHETHIELAFEGHRFWNLRRWMTATKPLNEPLKGWNIVGADAESFYNMSEGVAEPIDVWTKRKFTAPRDYLFPISSSQVQLSGVKQNPGW